MTDSLLHEAHALITGDRRRQYGDAGEEFAAVATILNALGLPLAYEPWTIPVILAVVKLKRITTNPTHRDSWRDLAGYAALGADIAGAVDKPSPKPVDKATVLDDIFGRLRGAFSTPDHKPPEK